MTVFTVRHLLGAKEGKGILQEWQGFPGKTLKEHNLKSEAHAAVNKLYYNANKA